MSAPSAAVARSLPHQGKGAGTQPPTEQLRAASAENSGVPNAGASSAPGTAGGGSNINTLIAADAPIASSLFTFGAGEGAGTGGGEGDIPPTPPNPARKRKSAGKDQKDPPRFKPRRKVIVRTPAEEGYTGPLCWHCRMPILPNRYGITTGYKHIVNGDSHQICELCQSHKRNRRDPELRELHCSVCGRTDVPYRLGGGKAEKVCQNCPRPKLGPDRDACAHCTKPYTLDKTGQPKRFVTEWDNGEERRICMRCYVHKRKWGDLKGCVCSECGRKDVEYQSTRTKDGKICLDCHKAKVGARPVRVARVLKAKLTRDGKEGPPKVGKRTKKQMACFHCRQPFGLNQNKTLQKFVYEVTHPTGKRTKHNICAACNSHRTVRNDPSLLTCHCTMCKRADVAYQPNLKKKICTSCYSRPRKGGPRGPARTEGEVCWHCEREFTMKADLTILRHNHFVEGVAKKICGACVQHKNKHGTLDNCHCHVCGRKNVSYQNVRGCVKVCVECPAGPNKLPTVPVGRNGPEPGPLRLRRADKKRCFMCQRPFMVSKNWFLERFNHVVGGTVHSVCLPCHQSTQATVDPAV